jgi:hypothetical protein
MDQNNEYLEICEDVAVADSNDDKGYEKLDQSRESSKPDNYCILYKAKDKKLKKYLFIIASGKFTLLGLKRNVLCRNFHENP